MNAFKWKHFEGCMILMVVRWYLRYSLSYRDTVELLEERGVHVAHTTIMRWVHQYGPELDKRVRRFLKPTTDSYRVDETYIKVKGQWRYLYRAVDSQGQTMDFMLSESRDIFAAKRFFKKALSSPHNPSPRVVTIDKNPAYPPALQQLKDERQIPQDTLIRQIKYLNNLVEQDHRFIKKITRPMLGFKSFVTAEKTLAGIEAMHMLRKKQVEMQRTPARSIVSFMDYLFGTSA